MMNLSEILFRHLLLRNLDKRTQKEIDEIYKMLYLHINKFTCITAIIYSIVCLIIANF